MDKKVTALIPARGGSVGVPKKNIHILNGKPLIAWTIVAAKEAMQVDRVIVSTEDREIAQVAREWGAEVPFLRPAELAKDNTAGIEPVLHALNIIKNVELVLMLQPTSPLRNSEDIDGIINFHRKYDTSSVVSVSEAGKHPYWTYEINNDDKRLIPFTNSHFISRRQDLPKAYSLNGAMYLSKATWLKANRTFITDNTLGYEMPSERSVDIDTLLDFEWIEFLMNKDKNPK